MRAGATIMFSENTEVRDGIAQLTARAATPAVAEALVREMAWYDAYLQRGRVDRSANTTPGNKAGAVQHRREGHGLHRQVGLGGHQGVLAPGEKLAPDSAASSTPPPRPATSSAARCRWPPA